MHRGGWPKGSTSKGATVSFGSYGLKSVETGLISARQIEAARRAITRSLLRGGKVWIRVFPDKPMTKKGEQTPMGKGKGAVDHYVAKITSGRILFELDGVSPEAAKQAMKLAAYKLPVKTKFVERHGNE